MKLTQIAKMIWVFILFCSLIAAYSVYLIGCNLQDNIVSPTYEDLHNTLYSDLNSQQRPFSGNIVGSFISTPTPNPIIYHSIANASGIATHIGSFTKVTNDTFNLATLDTWGSFSMTVANGDKLYGMYSGSISFGAPGHFSWDLDAEFTGGTGRFAQASGDFVFLAEGTYEIINGVVYGDYRETFNGVIIY